MNIKNNIIWLPKIIFAIFQASMNVVMRYEMGGKFKHIRSMFNVELGNFQHEEHNIDEAIKYYNKALLLDVNNIYAYSGLASAFIEKRLFLEAISYCKKALEIKYNLFIYITLYVAYDLSGNIEMSYKTMETILNKCKKNPAAVYNKLSHMYFFIKEYARALTWCKEAIINDPDQYGLYNNLAIIYMKQANYENAMDAFRKVIELSNEKKYTIYAEKEIKRIKNL